MERDQTLVVGGGIVGLTAALALQKANVQTLLIDPARERPPASWGNAGHIATEQVEPLASPAALASVPRRLTLAGGALALPPQEIATWLPFGLRLMLASRPASFAAGKAALKALLKDALPAWRHLVTDLNRPDLLIEGGHMVVWHGAEAARRGADHWFAADIGTATCRPSDTAELDRAASLLHARPAGGVTFGKTGQVLDPGAVLTAVKDAFLEAGGRIIADSVSKIDVEAGQAVAVTCGGTRLQGRQILVAAGVESAALLKPLGIKAPIIAERGYHIQAESHDWPESQPPLVFEERSMIVTRFAGGVRASSFVELSRHDAPPVTRRWERLEQHVAELGLPLRPPFRRWYGSRPTLPDYLPAIGKADGVDNLFYAFGHQHLGLTLGPITAFHLLDLLASGNSNPILEPFSLGRFK
ncbi:NAD(P)/FAD-dependent oxidoreductase [Oryzibacter oryziterrae]|uniref:NAD(P)/FAD-dependent oxidoreductase n=1 Tax=Oryzibacter oryziterrae TaxID=2766474 RepID=UPI001F19E835|nr:FAD-binding oxidoreductase [Oryzibacter oryziterrae]